MPKLRLKSKQAAFTIVELLIVIVVIGILAAITIIAYTGVSQRATTASLQSDLTNASQSLKLFQIDNNGYPATIDCAQADSATNKCLRASSGTTYQYAVSNTANPQAFVVTASKSGQVASISQNNTAVADGQNLLTGDSSVAKTTTWANEFVQYADLAPIFDQWGSRQYTISFDIKSANISTQNTVQVYMQNGSVARYYFNAVNVPVTTVYARQSITITPVLTDPSTVQSMLAFYGTYGTGNIVTVKNVKVEFGGVATTWTAG